MFDLSVEHTVTVSKDLTSLFDGQVFTLTKEIGCTLTLKEWLAPSIDAPIINNTPIAPPGKRRSNKLVAAELPEAV